MKLQQYHFTIKHRSGKYNANADALSRMYVEEDEKHSSDENECFLALGYESDSEAHSEGSDYRYFQEAKQRKAELRKARGKEPMYRNDYPPWEHQSRYPLCENCGQILCARTVRCNNDIDEDDSYWNPVNSDQYESDDSQNTSHYDTLRTYRPIQEKIRNIYLANLKEKQVIAGQPITTGGSKCTFACDTENHHIHNYCKKCKRNLPYGTVVHDCTVGFTFGKVRPGMDPRYLISVPWWKEPLAVQKENIHSRYQEIPYYQFTLVLSLPYEPYIADLD